MIQVFLNLLEKTKKEDLIKVTNQKIADAIIKVREGKIKIKPGYDGVYGQPIFEKLLVVQHSVRYQLLLRNCFWK